MSIQPKNTAFNHKKYQPFAFAPKMTQRTWPDKTITKAPIWTSVDLRDGNQALIEPMSIEQKMRFFDLLVQVGFKEIEIGFPSAAQVEYDFTRKLMVGVHLPDDVTLQVLVQAREHLIRRTFESLKGAKRAIVHVYNSTSKVQREKVYQKDYDDIIAIAVEGATLLRELAKEYPETEWIFEYSPESFSQTEVDFSVKICDEVCKVWRPDLGQKVIFNLPSTVESSTPNIYADQIEYFCQNLPMREHVIVSLHTHNDRGCAVAASELGLMAGADRIEGTLFGNGERTGNMDIMVMAMNMYSQGVDPQLDFSNMSEIAQVVSECNQLPIHPRHPYVGELVFTAFSGSHQDAIKKSLDYNEQNAETTQGLWDVAYLPIDPAHIGRGYQDVVRINSQSGKGGVAYILQRDFGFHLPRWTQIDFSRVIQQEAESRQTELTSDDVISVFENTYLNQSTLALQDNEIKNTAGAVSFTGSVRMGDDIIDVVGNGNGPLSAFINAISAKLNKNIPVINYAEHALTVENQSPLTQNNSDANAVAYLQLNIEGEIYSGIGTCSSTVSAMLKAALSALAQAQIADTEHH